MLLPIPKLMRPRMDGLDASPPKILERLGLQLMAQESTATGFFVG